jgi:hypothetical protein
MLRIMPRRDCLEHMIPSMSRIRRAFGLLIGPVLLTGSLESATTALAAPLDQLTDLTGKIPIVVTLKGRDNFSSEYRYDVSVRNNSADPIIADSLVIVLDKITNLAGEEREALKKETILSQFDVLGQDGETEDGKPFFRIPVGTSPDLAPLAESRPAVVRIRNKDYLIVFTPVFRVFGTKRPPPEPPKPPNAQGQPGSPQPQTDKQTEKLIQLLLKKGVITEEEWQKAMQP